MSASTTDFEDMKPRVNDPIQLHVQSGNASERYTVHLLGYAKGRTIIVSAPLANGRVVLLREGQLVIARSFSGTDAYGFSSNVLRVCNAPISYLHLSYPKLVKSVAVRKSARVNFNLIGSVNGKMEGNSLKGSPVIIHDLSVTGASFVASEPVSEMNEELVLTFKAKVNEIESYPTIRCIVRSIADEGGIGGATIKLRYGVQFQDVPQDLALLLQNMIYQKMLEQS